MVTTLFMRPEAEEQSQLLIPPGIDEELKTVVGEPTRCHILHRSAGHVEPATKAVTDLCVFCSANNTHP